MTLKTSSMKVLETREQRIYCMAMIRAIRRFSRRQKGWFQELSLNGFQIDLDGRSWPTVWSGTTSWSLVVRAPRWEVQWNQGKWNGACGLTNMCRRFQGTRVNGMEHVTWQTCASLAWTATDHQSIYFRTKGSQDHWRREGLRYLGRTLSLLSVSALH